MNVLIWAIAILVALLDQFSKFFISRSISPGQSISVVKNIFHLTPISNTGAAFGILKSQTIFFTAVSIFTAIAIIIYIRKKRDNLPSRDIALALILGGASGNIIDRLRLGYVVDFLDFRVWPVFNVADSAITIGALLLLVSLLSARKR